MAYDYRCSFCGKLQPQVRRLIAGPGGVYICNECVELCEEIISEENQQANEGILLTESLLIEIRERFAESREKCPLCGEPLTQARNRIVTLVGSGTDEEQQNVLWQCHEHCFYQRQRQHDEAQPHPGHDKSWRATSGKRPLEST